MSLFNTRRGKKKDRAATTGSDPIAVAKTGSRGYLYFKEHSGNSTLYGSSLYFIAWEKGVKMAFLISYSHISLLPLVIPLLF